MGRLIDALDAIFVEVRSPSGAITVKVTRQSDTSISLSPDARQLHDNDSLAEEIESTTASAWNEIKSRIHDELGRRKPAKRDGIHQDEDGLHLPQDLRNAVEAIDARGESPHGYVEAFMSGRGELFIEFKENVVRRTDVHLETLEFEIRSAIQLARQEWVKELKREYQKHQATRL